MTNLQVHEDSVRDDGARQVRFSPINCQVGFPSKQGDGSAKLSTWNKGARKHEPLCAPGTNFSYWMFDGGAPPADGTKIRAWLYTLEVNGHTELHVFKWEPRGEDEARTSNTAASQESGADDTQVGPGDRVPAAWMMSRDYHEQAEAAKRVDINRTVAFNGVRDVLVAAIANPAAGVELAGYVEAFDHMAQALWGDALPGMFEAAPDAD